MKILLNGATGKMGNELIKYIEKQENLKIVSGIGENINKIFNFPIYKNANEINENIDVIIDFSKPQATMNTLEYAIEKNIPMVIATTGLSNEQLDKIKKASLKIPIFISANMSLNINLMAKIVKEIAKVLQNAEIEIVETHHNRKIDAPSGTALLLANAINEVFENTKNYNFNRMQTKNPRDKNEIGFSSIRGGNIVGKHTILFYSENETLEITHQAYNRQVFAIGAIEAAKFLIKQNTGLYNMNDLVK